MELVQGSDAATEIPLEDESVDFLQSLGVLHHTSDPEAILRELHRVLRPGGRGLIMVYNRDSLWFHLYTAYEKMIVDEALPRPRRGRGVPPQHRRPGVPDFAQLRTGRLRWPVRARRASRRSSSAVTSPRTSCERSSSRGSERSPTRAWQVEHRDFLRSLTFDFAERPMHDGFHAGIGGTYHLRKH